MSGIQLVFASVQSKTVFQALQADATASVRQLGFGASAVQAQKHTLP